MKLKTADFQQACKVIALAVDGNAANLELLTNDQQCLFLNVTNREYYTSVKFKLDTDEKIHAVVDANLFLNLISGISSDEFDILEKETYIQLKTGTSSYKLAQIYENDALLYLPPIKLENSTVNMSIAVDILKSILNVNAKELSKLKNAESSSINEIQKLYYFTDSGCFNFTTGACLNSFTLEKPIQILLNDRLVHLFKLFNEDVNFSFGYDQLANGIVQAKVVFSTDSVYLASIITNDDALLSRIQGPCTATKNFINTKYPVSVVVSANELVKAISRLLLFTKNSISKTNMHYVVANITINDQNITLTDKLGNTESICVEGGSFVDSEYSMPLNIADLKLVLDSCKDEHITINCGNGRSVVLTRGNISNLIPESKRDN